MTHPGAAETTLIPVLYRDAGNYKEHGYYRTRGSLHAEHVTRLRATLGPDDTFIPTQVGLPHLGESLPGFPRDGDHVWHELGLDEATTAEVVPEAGPQIIDVGPIEEFIARMAFAAAEG